jgi:hypothetical protein
VVIVHHGPKHRTEEAAAETLGQMHRGAWEEAPIQGTHLEEIICDGISND